jgi:hypothetical protein
MQSNTVAVDNPHINLPNLLLKIKRVSPIPSRSGTAAT